MASTKDEITAIAVEHGYTGKKPASIAGAIDALADTLAGTDVKSGRSIAGAVKALAPYIGGGGGGIMLGELVDITSNATDGTSIQVSTRAYDISGETWGEIDEATGNTNVFYVGSDSCGAPCGCYLMMNTAVPSEWSPEDVQVTFNDEEISNFECRKGPATEESNPDRCLLTMQIPQDAGDLYIDLGIE